MSILACPACGGDLDNVLESRGLACKACAAKYPRLASIPWLFRHPEASLQEWKNQYHHLILDYDAKIARLKQETESRATEVLESTRERLTRLRKAYIEQKKNLQSILAPLEIEIKGNVDLLTALESALPPSQNLLAYDTNLHRDWAAWGEAENARSLELVEALLPKRHFTNAAVLGSGAGRLAYDLHRARSDSHWTALDINPLMMLAAQSIMNKASLELYEFPVAPLNAQSQLAKNRLNAPEPRTNQLELVLGDVWNPPLKNASFDVIVTPWLLDILKHPTRDIVDRINALLKPGGLWIYFGSLVFYRAHESQKLLEDELVELLGERGFELESRARHEIPYLDSPHSSQSRREKVLVLRAQKRAERDFARDQSTLPRWLEDTSLPVPRYSFFETELAVHEIRSEVLRLIDGKRSINDMLEQVQKLYGMEREEARQALSKFFASLAPGL
jgi:ubiquinone/menaquinone biosynthesis C-methylase UbiE/uncharacterized protein YbaR (Trm112 family)